MATYQQFGRWTLTLAGVTLAGVLAWPNRPNDARVAQRDQAELVEAATERGWALSSGTNVATLKHPNYFDPREMWVFGSGTNAMTNTVPVAVSREVIYGSANRVRRAAYGGSDRVSFFESATGTLTDSDITELWSGTGRVYAVTMTAPAVFWSYMLARYATASNWWTQNTIGTVVGNAYFLNWEKTQDTNKIRTARADPAREIMNTYTNPYNRMHATIKSSTGRYGSGSISREWDYGAGVFTGKRYHAYGVGFVTNAAGSSWGTAIADAYALACNNATTTELSTPDLLNRVCGAHVSYYNGTNVLAVVEVDWMWIDAKPDYPAWPAVTTGMVHKVNFYAECAAPLHWRYNNPNYIGSVRRIDNADSHFRQNAIVFLFDNYGDTRIIEQPYEARSIYFPIRKWTNLGTLSPVHLVSHPTTPAEMEFTFPSTTNAPACPSYPDDFSSDNNTMTALKGWVCDAEHTMVWWDFKTFTNNAIWQAGE